MSVMELVKYETILSLCIESLKPSFILGDKEDLMKERIRLEKAKKNGKQPEKDAEKKCKHSDDSNTELQQHEKSKKQNDGQKKSKKPKKRKQNRRKTKTGCVTAYKKITSCCTMGICQSSYK